MGQLDYTGEAVIFPQLWLSMDKHEWVTFDAPPVVRLVIVLFCRIVYCEVLTTVAYLDWNLNPSFQGYQPSALSLSYPETHVSLYKIGSMCEKTLLSC